MQFHNFIIDPKINRVQSYLHIEHQQTIVRLWGKLSPLATTNLSLNKTKINILIHTK